MIEGFDRAAATAQNWFERTAGFLFGSIWRTAVTVLAFVGYLAGAAFLIQHLTS